MYLVSSFLSDLVCFIYYTFKLVFLVLGVQTPNCIRQTVFDAVALDFRKVTVISDATAAATPDVHIGNTVQTILDYLFV